MGSPVTLKNTMSHGTSRRTEPLRLYPQFSFCAGISCSFLVDMCLHRKFAAQIPFLHRNGMESRMVRWIWENEDWPAFRWNSDALMRQIGAVHTKFGELRGALSVLGMRVGNKLPSFISADYTI